LRPVSVNQPWISRPPNLSNPLPTIRKLTDAINSVE